MRWPWTKPEPPAEPTAEASERRLRTRHPRTERELAVEAVERELHLPLHARRLHPGEPLPQAVAVAKPALASGRSWIKMIALCTLIGLVIGGAVVALMRFVDGPVSGKVKATLGAYAKEPTPTPLVLNTLSGINFSYKYPGSFQNIQNIKGQPGQIEQYMLATNSGISSPRRTISTSVYPLAGAGGLEEDSSYRLRANQPNVYIADKVTLKGEPAVVMRKASGDEQTLFWPHGPNVLVVAISSGRYGDDLRDIMKYVLDSVEWRS